LLQVTRYGDFPVIEEGTYVPADRDRVLISVNPKAGRRSAEKRVDHLERLLREHGFGVEIFTDLTEVAAQADRLHRMGVLRALIGVGGDGTAAELVNRTQQGVPVTLLATGTANLLSRYLGLGRDAGSLVETIGEGRLVRLDAGTAGNRLFLVNLGCGFDAEVVDRVHSHRQQSQRGGHIGYLSYVKPILHTIRRYDYPRIRVEFCEGRGTTPEKAETVVVRWVFALNLPSYGWGLRLAPDAVPTDGRLDVCTFRRGSLWNGLRYAAAAQFGGLHRHLSDCDLCRARRFRIESDEPVACQMDGDPGGMLPLDVECLPGRLTMVVPRHFRI
jgi:diacylglycerol kinase family enzyme